MTSAPLTRRQLLQLAGLAGAGLLAAAAIPGCGSKRAADGTVSMAITNDEIWMAHLKESGRLFEVDNPGTRIEITPLPEGAVDAWLVARTAAGQAPDIVELGVSAVSRYSRNGTAVDIAGYLPAGYVDSYLPVMRALVERDGQVFGLPKQASCMTSYYRTDFADQIGFRIPTSPEDGWTWDEFHQICTESQKLTGRYGMSYGYINANSGNRWSPMLYQQGGSLFTDDGRPNVTGPIAEDALAFAQSFYTEGLSSLSNTVKASQPDTASTLFASGQVGVMVHEAQYPVLKKKMSEELWGTTYMFTAERPATNLGGSCAIVTSSSPDPELATRFMAFALGLERSTLAIRERGIISPYQGLTPADIGYDYRPDDVAKSVRQLASVPEAVGRDMATRDYQTVREVLGDNLDLLFIGVTTPAEAADRINEGLVNA